MADLDMRRRIIFDFPDLGGLLFVPVCETCGRFVTADKTVSLVRRGEDHWLPWWEPATPNATCKRHGRVSMVWEGWE